MNHRQPYQTIVMAIFLFLTLSLSVLALPGSGRSDRAGYVPSPVSPSLHGESGHPTPDHPLGGIYVVEGRAPYDPTSLYFEGSRVAKEGRDISSSERDLLYLAAMAAEGRNNQWNRLRLYHSADWPAKDLYHYLHGDDFDGSDDGSSGDGDSSGSSDGSSSSSSSSSDGSSSSSSSSSSGSSINRHDEDDAEDALRDARKELDDAEEAIDDADQLVDDRETTHLDDDDIDDAEDDYDRARELYRDAADALNAGNYDLAVEKAEDAEALAKDITEDLDVTPFDRDQDYSGYSRSSSFDSDQPSSSASRSQSQYGPSSAFYSYSATQGQGTQGGAEESIVVLSTASQPQPVDVKKPFFNRSVFAGILLVFVGLLVAAIIAAAVLTMKRSMRDTL